MNIIETENLSYKYDESHFALSDLSIGFEKGKITTILGANGAGKSTLFLNMNGILKPHSGTVKFMGKPIGYSKKEIRELRKSVGIVFQDPDDQLFSASVFQDVSFGAMNLKLPQDEVVHLTENALKRTGIFDLKEGIIDFPITRKENSIIERCVNPLGDSAITNYKVIQELNSPTSLSVLDINLITGRTHQIRVHTSYLGHPIIGDSLYGNASPFISRQALHAYKIEFLNPITNKKMVINSELPNDMKQILNYKR